MVNFNTTYDEIYLRFHTGNGIDSMHLSDEEQDQIDLIHDGVAEYNLKLGRDLICDDDTETVNASLSLIEIQMIAECMKLVVYRKICDDFISTYQVFAVDLGRAQYNSQQSGLMAQVDKQNAKVDEYVFRLYDGYIGGDTNA